MSTATRPRAPSNLGAKAQKFWRDAVATYTFRLDELVNLEQACREIDLIDRLEEQLAKSKSLIVSGSQGQKVAHPHVAEIRQHRNTLATLLKGLGMVDAQVEAAHRSAQARAAANARWSRGAASA
jgi:phage terminase small subunit